MDPHYYRVRRAALGLLPGALVAVIPGLYVRQLWPEQRELPKNYGGFLYHDLAGDFVAVESLTPYRPSAPSQRRASRLRRRVATTGEPWLHLLR